MAKPQTQILKRLNTLQTLNSRLRPPAYGGGGRHLSPSPSTAKGLYPAPPQHSHGCGSAPCRPSTGRSSPCNQYWLPYKAINANLPKTLPGQGHGPRSLPEGPSRASSKDRSSGAFRGVPILKAIAKLCLRGSHKPSTCLQQRRHKMNMNLCC